MSEIQEINNGSLLAGMFWMIVLSVLLFWLPGLGPLLAGIVGGKLAGDVLTGLLAALLPGLLLALGLFFFGTFFTGLPVIGALLAGSSMILYLFYVPPLLIGALIGGLLA
jgi:hypothetical protein